MESWFLDPEKNAPQPNDVSPDIRYLYRPCSVLSSLKPNLPSDPFSKFHYLPKISVQGEPLPPLSYASTRRKGAWDIPTGSQHNVHATEKSRKNGSVSFSPQTELY